LKENFEKLNNIINMSNLKFIEKEDEDSDEELIKEISILDMKIRSEFN
jgi:hypothetical protein